VNAPTNRGRVVVAKLGLDGHTTGAAVVASGLRQAGFEVINLGTRVRPEEAVSVAIQEDADVIGVSVLSGAHVYLTGRLMDELRRQQGDAAVVVGGTIPEGDAARMRELGAAAVFGPGSSMPSIVECMGRLVAERRLGEHQAS
jgi:methylmalonyl-CoA mutase C-terminal domain/subunit